MARYLFIYRGIPSRPIAVALFLALRLPARNSGSVRPRAKTKQWWECKLTTWIDSTHIDRNHLLPFRKVSWSFFDIAALSAAW